MADFKCPFCGSDKLKIETPYSKVDYGTPGNPGTGKLEKQYTYCCRQQATNVKYQQAHRDYRTGETPNLEDLSRW